MNIGFKILHKQENPSSCQGRQEEKFIFPEDKKEFFFFLFFLATQTETRSGDFWEVLFSPVPLSRNDPSMKFTLVGLPPIQGKR